MKILIPLLVLASVPAFTVRPLVDRDVLEPSVQNEVDHALARAPTNLTAAAARAATNLTARAAKDVFGTNGLDATAVALKLVTLQRADGRWYLDGTNDVTAAAVEILKSLE